VTEWLSKIITWPHPLLPQPTYPKAPPDDPRLDPTVAVDAIDELVNESLARGKTDRR
jgi:hypothetical protein